MLALVVSPVSAQQAAAPGDESEHSSAPAADTVETGADPRAQYPGFMVNSYISVGIGYIDYRFTNRQLEPGFKAGSIDIPHLAARIALFGHQFNQYLSAEAVLARPGRWVSHHDVNGDGAGHSVWMNVGALTRRVMAFNLGVAGSAWRGRDDGHTFYTLAIYPILRFTAIRTTPADLFVFYSVAGPSYISNSRIDGHAVGRGFTFQDFLGVGLFLGPSKKISAQLKITHYSNGNFLTDNAGVKVPATFSLGYSFQQDAVNDLRPAT